MFRVSEMVSSPAGIYIYNYNRHYLTETAPAIVKTNGMMLFNYIKWLHSK